MTFYTFDLDLHPMELILKLDLDMVEMHPFSENEIPSFTMVQKL